MIVGCLSTDENIQLISYEKHLVFLSPRPFAPGAPIRMLVYVEEKLNLEGRCIGTRRVQEGFEVKMRLISLRKEARERLLTLFSPQEVV